MKFLAAFALITVVASAALDTFTESQISEIQQIINAIQSPSTDPTTAIALEAMLAELIGAAGIIATPVVESEATPDISGISAGPALVPAEVIAEAGLTPVVSPVVVPSPIIVPSPVSSPSAPLVQIILNIKQTDLSVTPVAVSDSQIIPTPVQIVDSAEIIPTPVQIVDSAEIIPTPVQIVDSAEVAPTPVQVIEVPEIIPTPVQIVDTAEVAPTPVQIVDVPEIQPTPIQVEEITEIEAIPVQVVEVSPIAVNLPETLN